jgi:tRNA(Ile)-lysidine synthase
LATAKQNNKGQSPVYFEQQINRALTPIFSASIIVAYSGGLDSTVLLHLVRQYPNVTAIHVNHNLSANAKNWQVHCQVTCQQWHIPFIAKSVHLTANDKGLEAEARKLRYGAIAESITPNSVVLTGQHQQDQLETFIIQLKRGAGPKGLSCMPHSTGFGESSTLLRPLLAFTRDELEQYALAHQLSWIEDESNKDTRFDRNFVRHQVLPIVQQRWPGFGKAAIRSIELISEQQQLVEEIAEQDLQLILLSANRLSCEGLRVLSNIRQRNVLRYWIATQGIVMPSAVILDNMLEQLLNAKQDATPIVKWSGYQLRRFKGAIYLFDDEIEKAGQASELTVSQPLTLNDNIGILSLGEDNTNDAMPIRPPSVDEKISVRFNVSGLLCKPQGSAHTRKLKDLFKTYHIPPWQRSRTPLLYYNDTLVAVVGLFVCEDGAVLSSHEHSLFIHLSSS